MANSLKTAAKEERWGEVESLLRKSCFSSKVIDQFIDACNDYGKVYITHEILSHCSTQQMGRLLTIQNKLRPRNSADMFSVSIIEHACETADYYEFAFQILPLVDDDFLSNCSTDQLERLLTAAAQRKNWQIVNRMFVAVGNTEKRVFIVENVWKTITNKNIPDCILTIIDDGFLSHCSTDQLDSLLTIAGTKQLWSLVNKVLKTEYCHDRWAFYIQLACETANYQNFTDHILPLVNNHFVSHCSPEQLDRLLAAARNREFWHMINSLVLKAEYSHDKWVFYIQLACETADYQNFTEHILPLVDDDFLFHCNTDQLGCMLTAAVRRKLWNMVNRVFTADVSHETRVWVIEQACGTAGYQNFRDHILPLVGSKFLSSCSAVHLELLLTVATKQQLWNIVDRLLKADYCQDTWVFYIQLACETADYQNFTKHILPLVDEDFLSHCSPELLDRLLTVATRQGLWNMVNRLFTADVSHETRLWVIEQACETADCQNFRDHILPHVDDDFLSQYNTEQLDRFLKAATKRAWWHMVNKVFKVGGSHETRLWVIEQACKTAGYQNFTDHILPLIDNDLLPHCSTEQLESLLTTARKQGLWNMVNRMLKADFSQEKRVLFIEEACRSTFDWIITDNILPLLDNDFLSHCSTEQLDYMLTVATSQHLWTMVNNILKSVISHEKRYLVIEQACKTASYQNFTDHILPHVNHDFLSFCTTKQLDSLLRTAREHNLWNMVKRMLKDSHDERVCNIEQACETVSYQFFTYHILPLVDDNFLSICNTDQLDRLLTAATRRKFWNIVNRVFTAEVSHETRVSVIKQACETTGYQNFTEHILQIIDDGFLTHCSTVQLNWFITAATISEMWNMVNRVFTADVSHETRVWVIEQAYTTAGYQNFTGHILPLIDDDFLSHCSTEKLESLLTTARKHGLWNMVNRMLKADFSHEKRVLFIEEVSKSTFDWIIKDNILPLLDYDFLSQCSTEQLDHLLTVATKRAGWAMVNRVFKVGGGHETRLWVIEQACETADYQNFTDHILPLAGGNFLSSCSPEQLEPLLTAATRGKLWNMVNRVFTVDVSHETRVWVIEEACKTAGDNDMMYYILPHCRDDQLESVLRQLVTRGLWRSVNNVLERGVKTKSCTLALSEACKDCAYPSAMDRIEQRLGKSSVQLLVCSLKSNQLSQEAKNVAIRFALKQHRWRIIKGTGLLQVWEQVRRNMFRKAVEQKQWTIVNKWADHNLYDDERWWALEEAYTHKQWDVMLQLADHGLTEIELMRVRYRLAKHADWDVVLRMVRRGVDVTEVREVVQSAMISRKTAADEAKKRALTQRWRQFCQLEEKLTQASARRFKVPSTAQQWRTTLFRLHRHPGTLSMSLRQHQRSKTIDMLLLQRAIEQSNWHVVIHLVRLGVHPDQRDSLLTDMIRRRQWGVCRALLEQGISVKTCLRALSVFMEMNQWMLVARVLEFITDDALKGQIDQLALDRSVGSLVWQCVSALLNCGMCVGDAVKMQAMKRAMECREGSVVGECISTMQHYRLSEKERTELLQQAICRGVLQAVKPLVGEKDEIGIQHRDTALLAAIEQRQWDVVDCCQFQGADIDMKDESGETPLCREFRKEAIEVVDWKAVENLVIRGAYPNVLDKDGCSVLNRAIGEKQWDIARLLIEYHGDIHKAAHTKLAPCSFDTPLQFLIGMRQGEIIHHTLLWCPDQAKGVSHKGETTLHAMTLDWRPELLYYQVVRGVSPLTLTKGGHSALLYAVQNEYCPQKMVAECIRLGFSTHQPRLTQLTTVDIAASVTYGLWRNVDNFHEYFYHGIHRIHSPFLLAVLRGMHVVAHMLHESGSCSYAELLHMYTLLQDLADPHTELGGRLLQKANPSRLKQGELGGDDEVDELIRYGGVPSSLLKQSDSQKVYEFVGKQTKLSQLRKQGDSDEYKQIYDLFIENIITFLPYLKKIASTPRSLESSCRLAISHCLTVCRRRERAVRELDLTDTMKNYLLFSDLTDPKYNPWQQLPNCAAHL